MAVGNKGEVEGGKLLISNLDEAVSESDIREEIISTSRHQ